MNEDQKSESLHLTRSEEAGGGMTSVADEEAPFPTLAPSRHVDPQPIAPVIVNDAVAPPASPTQSPDKPPLVASDEGDANVGGLGIGCIDTIGDEETPPIHPHQFEDIEPKRLKMKGSISIEQDLASAPFSEEDAAFAYDDSLERTGKKQCQDANINIPEVGDGSDAQVPPSTLPSISTGNTTDRDEVSTTPAHNFSINTASLPNAVTADVQTMSPYINDMDEIIIPEATAVNPEDIPSATIIRPEKYSLTIAGHKIQLRFLALGAILILAAAIALAVTLTKTSADPLPVLPAPSSVPSVSLFPTLNPSMEPSTGPSTVLQAELVNIISEYSGGNISSSISDRQSNHRIALDWLVRDQSQWREEKEHLSNTEIAERFALALLYYETRGEEWFQPFEFLTSEHVCNWKGALFRTIRKGVTSCTNGISRRVKNLTLWDNHLQGGLPKEISWLQELTALHIGLNDIQGNMPSTLGSLTKITHLELNNNDLAGPIDSLSGLANLKFLDLSSNEMTGTLMDASNLTNLESFKASGNKFTGSVPKSFSRISPLETLHLQWNQLSGNIDFFCQDLPLDYQLDCGGNAPEVECACCVGCTIVNDTVCDLETEKLITFDINAGNRNTNFNWQLIEEYSGDPIAAGGDYDDGQQLNIQLCLSFGWHEISMSADVIALPPSLSPTYTPTFSRTTTETPSPTFSSLDTRSPAYPQVVTMPNPTEQIVNQLTTTQSPNLQPTPQPSCADTPGYSDLYGDGCDYYKSDANYPQACQHFGENGGHGLTPNENCCACQSLQVPIIPSPQVEFQSSCTDTPGYSDPYGDGCEYYGADVNYPQACQYFGDQGENGTTPKENCCVCDGVGVGLANGLLHTSNTPSTKPTNVPESLFTPQSLNPARLLPTDFPVQYVATLFPAEPSPSPTYPPVEALSPGTPWISFSIQGNSVSLGPHKKTAWFLVSESPTLSPTHFPTASSRPSKAPSMSAQPTSSSFPTTATISPTTPAPTWEPTFGATPTVGTYRTFSPTQIFTRPLPPLPCYTTFELNLNTDAFGVDTGWEIVDRNDDSFILSESGFESNKTLQFRECLKQSGCYEFAIKDDWGDGICCQEGSGSYNVSVNGRLIGSGGEFGSSETKVIGGNCGVNLSPEGSCPEDYSSLNVTILTDRYPSETSWEVVDTDSGQIHATNEYVLEYETSTSLVKCIPLKECFQFNIHDSCGDGGAQWNLEYDGKFIDSGEMNSGHSDAILFGDNCNATEGWPSFFGPTPFPTTPSIFGTTTTPAPITPFPTESTPFPTTTSYPTTSTGPSYFPTKTAGPSHSPAPSSSPTISHFPTPSLTTPFPTHPRKPTPTPPTPGRPAFNCPSTDLVGCTAPDPSDLQDECPTVGEPCNTNGEFCCQDGCPRNICTAKEGIPP